MLPLVSRSAGSGLAVRRPESRRRFWSAPKPRPVAGAVRLGSWSPGWP